MPEKLSSNTLNAEQLGELEREVARQLGVPSGVRFGVDIEVTNRCNAKCHFCPRDATPHQGLMTPEVFDRSLERAIEHRKAVLDAGGDHDVVVSLCGLGEPLLNRHAATFVADVRTAGLECEMSTNASLLDTRRGSAVLDAGLQRVFINAGDRDASYEDVYRLPFERTRDNIVHFLEMAEGRCEVFLVLVDYRRDPEHVRAMEAYWRQLGVSKFANYDIMNRGGTLFVDDMQFQSYPQLAQAREILGSVGVDTVCSAPFRYLFIGYDGMYYLCCSDWQKQVPLGGVFDTSFLAIVRQKLEHARSREPICKTCNHDPINRMAYELRAIDAGEADASCRDELIAELRANSEVVDASLRLASTKGDEVPKKVRHPFPRHLIPVTGD